MLRQLIGLIELGFAFVYHAIFALMEKIGIYIAVVMLFLCMPINANAMEVQEELSELELEQEKRLNALEIRLEEIGYLINDIKGTLEAIQTSELLEEEERLAISDKVDVLIIGVNDLINHEIEILGKYDMAEATDAERQLLTEEYRVAVLESLATLNNITLQQYDSTVSGNTLISQLDENMTVNNEESRAAAEEYITYILIFAGIAIGCIIGSIFSRYIKHE